MEKSFIVGVFASSKPEHEISSILEELRLLTFSAGGQVVDIFWQKKKFFDTKYLLGKGKAAEIKNRIWAKNIKLVVFYNQLTNTQQRNLEGFFSIKVIDRTRLILDIFAHRARSLEGKLQVELAQLLYLLPRLTGKGIELSRLGGGIGTRGPGETKLEADRRRIKKKISLIKNRLNRVIKNRNIQRKNRKLFPVPIVSLVGYTSAGKSTLFKTLTGEDVFISNKLFSTLDPLLRRVDLDEIDRGYYFLLSDTVGFIREMPGELLESFKATLEEIIYADIILHVVDISGSDYTSQKSEVEKILREMKIPDHKIITVYNKIDLLDARSEDDLIDSTSASSTARENGDILAPPVYPQTPGSDKSMEESKVFVSAKEAIGILEIKKIIFLKYFKNYQKFTISIPQHLVNLNFIKNWAIVTHQSIENGTLVAEVLCSSENMLKFKENFGGYVK